MPRIALVGDPHGRFDVILPRLLEVGPAVAVFLGDMFGDRRESVEPLRRCLAPLDAAGIDWRWIHGNHDADNEVFFEASFGSAADLNISGRVEALGGIRVAGLGGVFRGRIWNPKTGDGVAKFPTRSAYLATLPKSHRYKDGLPISQRASIFLEDVEALAGQTADVLVTHEAPSGYWNPQRNVRGYEVLDTLAASIGARIVVHGHHHHAYACQLPNGILCAGLGLAQVVLLEDLLSIEPASSC